MKHAWLWLLLLAACSDSAKAKPDSGAADGAASTDASFDSGAELRVTVPESGRVFVKLDPPSIATQADWDLAFEGNDVFTNGGASGSGKGGSFGPLDTLAFASDDKPEVPFVVVDKPGGAFLDWYAYDGSQHALWSRYHVYGVRDGQRTFKVQLLSYYGEVQGAPVSAIYTVRWADVSTPNDIKTLTEIDGTAGGLNAPPNAPSECLDLGTGVRTMVSPSDARTSMAWHLCFRRDAISVNGELGGPRGIGAVDLQAADTKNEKLLDVQKRTADNTKSLFDQASFDGKTTTFRGDRIVSGFVDWIDAATSQPVQAAWLAVGATAKNFLVGFVRFENPTTKSPGTVVMRIKPVKG